MHPVSSHLVIWLAKSAPKAIYLSYHWYVPVVVDSENRQNAQYIVWDPTIPAQLTAYNMLCVQL